MSNALYPKFKEALLGAGINLASDTIAAILVDTGSYTYAATDQYLSAIPSAARIGSPVVLAGKSVSNGVFAAANSTFTSVPAGTGSAATVEALVLYKSTGTDSTSPLIAYIDTATGLPFTPNGSNESVTWNAGGIFTL